MHCHNRHNFHYGLHVGGIRPHYGYHVNGFHHHRPFRPLFNLFNPFRAPRVVYTPPILPPPRHYTVISNPHNPTPISNAFTVTGLAMMALGFLGVAAGAASANPGLIAGGVMLCYASVIPLIIGRALS